MNSWLRAKAWNDNPECRKKIKEINVIRMTIIDTKGRGDFFN